MNIYKKLLNNSLVFAIGNLGTKLIIFFLVPLYTYYLSTSEFGMVDLFTTTVSLFMPIFTLSISDSVLRFVMDKAYDKQAVLINSIIVIFIGSGVLLLMYPLLIAFFPFDDYILYFYFLILIQAIFTSLNEYVRAKGMVRLFAASGIINALSLLLCNILFLVILKSGVIGYLLSLIVSYVISIIFLLWRGKVPKDISIKKINVILLKKMLIYSVPLIPNALMWWVMTFSDRYIISYMLGLSANGLYAVANKIPSILTIINSIFFQAWQMSAIEEADSNNKSVFFSNVFKVFSITMLVSTSFILAHLKFIVDLLVSDAYFEAWKYVPFLLLGVVFSSFSGFLGTNYIAARKTSGVFKTSIVGALINVASNILLIPLIGINGASIGTMLGFLVIWLLRIIDTRKFVKIKLNIRNLLLALVILSLQISLLYSENSVEYLIQISLFLSLILLNFKEMKIILNKIPSLKRSKQ